MPSARRRRLERAIRETGLTNREFAARVGVHGATLRSWLGCRENPSEESRHLIADALGFAMGADCDSVWRSDVDWLLEPEDGVE